MADPNTRQGKRTPVTLKIKFKSETLEQFIERYAVDVSQGGIFIRTKEPLAVGTQMRFEFQLRDASPLIAGEGTVVWTRENDPSRPAIAPGMGVRFDRLAEGSQGVLERILSEKAKQAPQRPTTETTKPPLFTDTPTRVAPAPVQEALLGGENASGPKRKRPDSFGDQGTPLPRPMPFHSDADEFPEEAFEEATKVRALDELIAQTAEAGAATATTTAAAAPAPSEDRKRADSTIADPPRADTTAETPHTKATVQSPPLTVADRDSAPGLPSPPEPTPKPAEAPREARSSTPPATEPAKTKLGMEPAKIPLRPSTPSTPPATSPAPARPVAKDAITKPTGMRAVAAEPTPVEEKKKSSGAPIVLLLLLVLAAAGAAVWFFVIRPGSTGDTNGPGSGGPGSSGPGSGSAVATNPGSDTGSNGSAGMTPGSGSAVDMNGGSGSATALGSNGSAGSAAVPAAELVETTITAPGIDKATVEVEGTDQKGPAPLKARLEKGKAYKAHVTAPGYLVADVDVKGGDKATAKLTAKPRVITVHSTPDGALISVDGATTGHSTPFDLELTKVQAAKKSVRIGLRKAGFKPTEKLVDLTKLTEEADKMTDSVDASLDKAPVVVVPPNNGNGGGAVKTNGGNGSGANGGSAGSGTGAGSAGSGAAGTGGGAEPNNGGTGTGTGSAEKPTGTGTGAGSAEKPSNTDAPKTPPAGTGSGSAAQTPKEPEPDFAK